MRPETMGKRTESRGAGMKTKLTLVVVLAALLGLPGCSEEAPTGAPTTSEFSKEREALAARSKQRKPPKRKAPAEPEATAVAESGSDYASSEQDYFYDPRGRRDPFRSFRFDAEDGEKKDFGPLGDFELGQLELQAVIWDAGNPRALILDPGGRSYIVREGSQIGKNNGQVIHIGDNLVLVKETYENFAGEQTTKDVELRIRLSQGG